MQEFDEDVIPCVDLSTCEFRLRLDPLARLLLGPSESLEVLDGFSARLHISAVGRRFACRGIGFLDARAVEINE